MFEAIYYTKVKGKVCNPSKTMFKSKEEFLTKIENYNKEHPDKKLFYFDEDSDEFNIIKWFEQDSPIPTLKRNLNDLRDYYNTVEDVLRNIEYSMERLEKQFLKEDSDDE